MITFTGRQQPVRRPDWLVGINATRALTCKYNAQLSCGRVQTPTLAMIARRETGDQRVCAEGIFRPDAESRRYPLELAG